jgi:hypothetical protein
LDGHWHWVFDHPPPGIAMRQRGRPSALAVVPRSVAEVIERIQPPSTLTNEQAEVWHAIVVGHPADWFASGSIPVLAQLCRHVVIVQRLAELLEHGDEAEWFNLVKEQRAESMLIARLANMLRLTPQSLIDHTSGNHKKHLTPVGRPWAVE